MGDIDESLGERTIRDFGEQWDQWGENSGYYGSLELLQDILGPLLPVSPSIGVIQFIPDPEPTLRAARAALRPGGRLVLWVYAREGWGPYVMFVKAMRAVATRVPHAVLHAASGVLNLLLDLYIFACRFVPLPMRSYIRGHLGKLDREQRRLTIYDQLNPSHVVFYRGPEIEALVRRAGFGEVRLHHRHGYSWTVLARRD